MSSSLTRIITAAAAALLLAASTNLCAQTTESTNKIQVIPAPKQMTPGEGSFALRDARVALADPKSSDDQFAAQDFINDVKTAAGATLSMGRGRRAVLIG